MANEDLHDEAWTDEEIEGDADTTTSGRVGLYNGDVPGDYSVPELYFADPVQRKLLEAARVELARHTADGGTGDSVDTTLPYTPWLDVKFRPGIYVFIKSVNIPVLDTMIPPATVDQLWEILEALEMDRIFLFDVDCCRPPDKAVSEVVEAFAIDPRWDSYVVPRLKVLYFFAKPDWASRGWRMTYRGIDNTRSVPNPEKAEDDESHIDRWTAEHAWRSTIHVVVGVVPWEPPELEEVMVREPGALDENPADFDFIHREGDTATVNMGIINPKGKGHAKAPNNCEVVKVRLDDSGKAIPEDRFGTKRSIPTEVVRIVDAIHSCPTYRGLPKKSHLAQHHPNYFTKRGDIAHHSPLRNFLPEELGIARPLWNFLNNNFAHHQEHAENNPNATVTGRAMAYEPRRSEQVRQPKGQFGASKLAELQDYNPVNPDPNVQHPLIVKTAILHAVKQGKITAEDLGMTRMGTAWKSLHTAAVAIISRQHQIEVWANEERRRQASQRKFYTQQVTDYHTTAVQAVEQATALKDLLKAHKIGIPQDLVPQIHVNRTRRRYRPDLPSRRTREFKQQISTAMKTGPTPLLPVDTASVERGSQPDTREPLRAASKRVKRDRITGKGRAIPVEDEADFSDIRVPGT